MIGERYFTFKKIIPIEESVSFFLVFNNGECLSNKVLKLKAYRGKRLRGISICKYQFHGRRELSCLAKNCSYFQKVALMNLMLNSIAA